MNVEMVEIWIAFRRHPLMGDGKPCPGCGMKAIHEMLGIGVATGNMSSEQMAIGFCTEERDFIGRSPVNTLLPGTLSNLPGAYYPLTGKPVFPLGGEDESEHDPVAH